MVKTKRNQSDAPDTYILTWNPDSPNPETRFDWDKHEWFVRQTANGKQPSCRWSTGNTKRIQPGDRLFLFRQGKQRGLIGSGNATSPVASGEYRRLLIRLTFDTVLSTDQILPVADLQKENLGVNWKWIPASGVPVQEESAERLEQLWQRHLQTVGRSSGEGRSTSSEGSELPILNPNDGDEVRRVLREINERIGQPQFRQRLLEVYSGQCAITGCDAEPALEAAHIIPYSGASSNRPSNGILLRADMHKLFDLGLICIHPKTLTVAVSKTLCGSEYEELHGKKIRLPSSKKNEPDPSALKKRHRDFLAGRVPGND